MLGLLIRNFRMCVCVCARVCVCVLEWCKTTSPYNGTDVRDDLIVSRKSPVLKTEVVI